MNVQKHEFDVAESAVLDAAIEGYSALCAVLPAVVHAHLPPDIAPVDDPAARSLIDALDSLTAALARRALRPEAAPDDAELARLAAEVRDRGDDLARSDAARAAGTQQNPPRELVLGSISARVGEVALEEFDAAMLLAADHRTGRTLLVRENQNPAAAHVKLLERLHQRLELIALTNPLLVLEREASEWHFQRLSTPGTGVQRQNIDFTRGVREQEWSLVDRPAIAFGQVSVAEVLSLMAHSGDPLPHRQRDLLGGLLHSAAGIFRVERRAGPRTTLRDLGSGDTFDVTEHAPDITYGTGWLGLGRVIEVAPDLCIRSPGMVMIRARSDDALIALAGSIAEKEPEERAIPIEGAISMLVLGNRKLPRRLPPAPSRSAAEQTLQTLFQELEREGLLETVDGDGEQEEATGNPRPPASDALRSFTVDETMAEWITALIAMAESTRRGRSRSSGGVGGSRKKRRRRR